MEYESEFEHLVEAAYARESHEKEEYFKSLNERVKKIMKTYAVWLYELMAGIHKHRFTREQTREYVIFHLESIKKTIPDVVSPDKQQKISGTAIIRQDRKYRSLP